MSTRVYKTTSHIVKICKRALTVNLNSGKFGAARHHFTSHRKASPPPLPTPNTSTASLAKPLRITVRSGLGLRGYKLTAELNLGKFWRICYPGVTISQQQKNRPAPLQTLNPRTSGRCLGERAGRQRDRSTIRRRGVAVGGISQLAQIGDASLKVLRDKRL